MWGTRTFVGREVDGAVNVDGQVGVELDARVVRALIVVVTTPRLVPHIRNRKALLRRQLEAFVPAPVSACSEPTAVGVAIAPPPLSRSTLAPSPSACLPR
jgi:hypothetical protein